MLNAEFEVFPSKFKIRYLTFVIFISIVHQLLKLSLFAVGFINQLKFYVMEKFDLNALGVMEINGRESIFINGGNEPPLNSFLTPDQLEYAGGSTQRWCYLCRWFYSRIFRGIF